MPARRTVLLAGGALLATVLVGAGANAAFAGDRVPGGTTVQTLDLGGLTRADAVARLAGGLTDERSAEVTLVSDDQELTLDPRAAGLDLDVEATVEQALDVGPFERLRLRLGGGREVTAVPTVDDAALDIEIDRLAESFDRISREGSVTFDADGEPVETLPETGRRLDRDAAALAVRRNYLAPRVAVPSTVTAVRTSAEDVRQALEDVARPAIAATVEVTAGGGTLTVHQDDIAAALSIRADDQGELTPQLDPKVLAEQVASELTEVGQPPVDATFRIENGTPVLVPAQDGTSISPADLVAAVAQVLTDPAPRTVAAPLTPASARVTTERAGQLGIVEQLGTFTSNHPCCQPRVTNIHRIADIVDGYVLLPGEQFDLNAVVGRRDTERGFVAAPQILDGEFVDSVGGGISQFTTALFNAVFFSGLKDIAHSPHSYYISRYPAGRESTVSFPKPDFIFENDSPTGVLMKTSYTDTGITVTFWGTKRFDEVRSVSGPRTRVFVTGGSEVRREAFSTRYLPQPRVICGPPPAPEPLQAPAASPTPTPSAAPAA